MSNADVSLFKFPQSEWEVRVVFFNGNPWFVSADVCRSLGLKRHPNGGYAYHLRTLKPEEITPISEVGVTLSGTGMQYARLVSEAGLYKLVMRSDKPEAREFQDWIAHEVLPAIRKNGGYVAGQEKMASGEMSREEFLAKAFVMAQATIAEMEQRAEAAMARAYAAERRAGDAICDLECARADIDVLAPKAAFVDEYVASKGDFTVRQSAAILGLSQTAFVAILTDREGGPCGR